MVVEDDDTDWALTKHAIWPNIIESFKLLEEGVCEGAQIAGGDRFCLWACKGDMDWMCNFMDLPGHWASHSPCQCCKCSKNPDDPSYFLNFADSAKWKTQIYTDMPSRRRHIVDIGEEVNLLIVPQSEGGLGLHLFAFLKDLLHTGDTGVASHLNGNILWLLRYTNAMSTDRQQNIKVVWSGIEE